MILALLLSLFGFSVVVDPAAARRAQAPVFRVTFDAGAGYSPVVETAGVLADDALEQAVRSGLPLRLRYRVELWRDRFFDELVGQESWSAVLLHEPLEGGFTVRTPANPGADRPFASYDEARADLEQSHALALRPTRPGRYYYVAVLEIETLSLSDLEELEQWLRGELRPAVTGERSLTGAIGQGIKRLAIRLLGMPTRRFEARSGSFTVP